MNDDLIGALKFLGYKGTEAKVRANFAISRLGESAPTELLVKEALRKPDSTPEPEQLVVTTPAKPARQPQKFVDAPPVRRGRPPDLSKVVKVKTSAGTVQEEERRGGIPSWLYGVVLGGGALSMLVHLFGGTRVTVGIAVALFVMWRVGKTAK